MCGTRSKENAAGGPRREVRRTVVRVVGLWWTRSFKGGGSAGEWNPDYLVTEAREWCESWVAGGTKDRDAERQGRRAALGSETRTIQSQKRARGRM